MRDDYKRVVIQEKQKVIETERERESWNGHKKKKSWERMREVKSWNIEGLDNDNNNKNNHEMTNYLGSSLPRD